MIKSYSSTGTYKPAVQNRDEEETELKTVQKQCRHEETEPKTLLNRNEVTVPKTVHNSRGDDSLSISTTGETEHDTSVISDGIVSTDNNILQEKEDLKSEITDSEIRDLKLENKKLKHQNEEQAKTIAKLQDSAEKLKKTLSDTQVKVSNQTKHISSLSTKVKELKEQLSDAVAKTLSKEEELTKSKKSVDRLREEKQKLNNSISNRNAEKDQVKELQTCVSDLQDSFSTLRIDNNKLKQKLETTISVTDFQIP